MPVCNCTARNEMADAQGQTGYCSEPRDKALKFFLRYWQFGKSFYFYGIETSLQAMVFKPPTTLQNLPGHFQNI